MKEILEFRGHKVFHEIKPRLRHAYIRIDKDGQIVLRSGSLSVARAHKIILQKEKWILTQLKKHLDAPQQTLGKNILFFGRLVLLEEDKYLTTLAKRFKNEQPMREDIMQRHYYNFYKTEAQLYIPDRIIHFSQAMNLFPSELKFRRMKRRWGSCSSQGIITFNTLLIQLSKEQIDYVIVHELAHLKHLNHSAAFHQLVADSLPDAQRIHLSIKNERML